MAEKYVVTKAKMDALASKGGSTTAKGLDVFALPAYPPTPQIPGDGSAEADFDVSDVATAEVYAEVLLVLQNWVREAMEKEGSL